MLRCIAKYKSSYGAFQLGDIIDDPVNEPGILASSPNSFEVIKPESETKQAQPEVDKMIRRGRVK